MERKAQTEGAEVEDEEPSRTPSPQLESMVSSSTTIVPREFGMTLLSGLEELSIRRYIHGHILLVLDEAGLDWRMRELIEPDT